MEAIDRPEPVTLSQAHIPQAMELSQEAGWNQLPADWRLFMTQGQVFGVFIGPVLAATAAIIPYGRDHAWIGMVLTRRNRRGQGLGTALLNTCIAELETLGRTALLDATPAGEPIYRKLGFEDKAARRHHHRMHHPTIRRSRLQIVPSERIELFCCKISPVAARLPAAAWPTAQHIASDGTGASRHRSVLSSVRTRRASRNWWAM